MDNTAPVIVVSDLPARLDPLQRQLLQWGLSPIAVPVQAHAAWAAIGRHRPGLIVLDSLLLKRSGDPFLRLLRVRWPAPIVLQYRPHECPDDFAAAIASCDAIACLPRADVRGLGPELRQQWRGLLQRLALGHLPRAQRSQCPRPVSVPRTARPTIDRVVFDLIVIGASAGGPEAVERLLGMLPVTAPPIAVVIHMPRGFTASYAERLDASCLLSVREARDGQDLTAGTAIIAAGGRHCRVRRSARGFAIQVDDGPSESGHRPSVDALFRSALPLAGPRLAAIILTGMGADGAEGMLALRHAGAVTIAQSEEDCAIYGMPRSAVKMGAAVHEMSLAEIAMFIAGGQSEHIQGREIHTNPSITP